MHSFKGDLKGNFVFKFYAAKGNFENAFQRVTLYFGYLFFGVLDFCFGSFDSYIGDKYAWTIGNVRGNFSIASRGNLLFEFKAKKGNFRIA